MGVSAKQNLLKLNPALIRNITKIEKNKNKNKSRPITKATVKMLMQSTCQNTIAVLGTLTIMDKPSQPLPQEKNRPIL